MTKKKTVVASKKSVAGDFGFSVAVIDSNKELTELFNTMTASYKKGVEWSQSKFNIAPKRN